MKILNTEAFYNMVDWGPIDEKILLYKMREGLC